MTEEKRQKLEEIIKRYSGIVVPLDGTDQDLVFAITELKAAWQREEDLLKGLDSIRDIVLSK